MSPLTGRSSVFFEVTADGTATTPAGDKCTCTVYRTVLKSTSVCVQSYYCSRHSNLAPGGVEHAYPGAKVRVITREARYYAKTRAFASFYAIISRAHAARAVT